MYGKLELDPYNVLRYGLIKEFTDIFASLKFSGIELPMLLIHNFHSYINNFVDENYTDEALVSHLQSKHSLYTFYDVQKSLKKNTDVKQDFSTDKSRNSIAVTANHLPFMVDRFPGINVLVLMKSPRAKEFILPGKELPRTYRVINAGNKMNSYKFDPYSVCLIHNELDKLLQNHCKHAVFGHPKFRLWLRKQLIYSIKAVHFTRQMLCKEPIKLILSNTEVSDMRTALLSRLAAQHKLPFIYAPDNLINERNLIPSTASHYCAWGEHYRVWMEKIGIERSKIYCTGNLRFEYEHSTDQLDRTKLSVLLNIPKNNLLITFATQSFGAWTAQSGLNELNPTLIQWINQAVSGYPVTVLIKPHPGDKFNYASLKEKNRNLLVAPSSIKLYDLLNNSDFIMTVSSTVAIEAALLHKGIIVLQPRLPELFRYYSNDYHAHLAKAKAGYIANSPESLRVIIAELCTSEDSREKLHRIAHEFISKTIHKGSFSTPSEDIYKLIKSLLNPEKGNSDAVVRRFDRNSYTS